MYCLWEVRSRPPGTRSNARDPRPSAAGAGVSVDGGRSEGEERGAPASTGVRDPCRAEPPATGWGWSREELLELALCERQQRGGGMLEESRGGFFSVSCCGRSEHGKECNRVELRGSNYKIPKELSRQSMWVL